MKNLAVILLAISLNTGFCQSGIEYEGRDFHELEHELQTYYDSLIQAGDTSLFYEGGPYTEFRRWEQYWSLRMPVGKSFEDLGEAKKNAYQSMPARLAGPKSNTDPWHEIGPLDKPISGINGGFQNMEPGIGPIRFITFCPDTPDLVLCGANDYGGGLFHIDVSVTDEWTPSGSDDWPKSACQHAVFNTADPDIWYAATHGYLEHLGGIHRKDPLTGEWDRIADESDLGYWTKIFKLLPVPGDQDKLYAATSRGLYLSIDVNASDPQWMPLSLPPPVNDPIFGQYIWSSSQYTYDLEMDPGNDQHLYATVRFKGSLDVNNTTYFVYYWRILQSFDAGSTWAEIANAPDNTWFAGSSGSPQNYELVTLETTTANPNLLYVFFDNVQYFGSGTTIDEVWKIEDLVNPIWNPVVGNVFHKYGGGNGFGVSQTTADDVYIGDDDRYKTLVAGIENSYGNSHPNAWEYHVDVEDLVSHPTNPNEVWMADHGGIHRSIDDGVSWEWFGKGLGVADIWEMADSYSESGYIALGLYHDGNVISDGNYYSGWKPDWHQMGGLDGQHPVIDPKEGNYVYWQSQQNIKTKRSDDHGQTGTPINSGLGSTDFHTNWIIDREQTNILFTHYIESYNPRAMELMRTMNRGDNWEVVSNFSAIVNGNEGNNGKNIRQLYKPYSHPEQLVAKLKYNNVDVNNNNAKLPTTYKLMRIQNSRASAAYMLDLNNWEELQQPTVLREDPNVQGQYINVEKTDQNIADVAFDNEDPNIVYIAYGTALRTSSSTIGSEMLFRMDYNLQPGDPGFQTDLTGVTANALPNVGMGWDAIVVERGSNGGIYLATDLGVFYTNNELWASGDEWVPFGTGLPHGNCHGIEINYKINKLRVAMPGRGMWEHDLYCPADLNALESGTYTNDLFLEVKEDIASTAVAPVAKEITYRGGTTVDLLPGFHAEDGSDFHAFIHPCNNPGNSFKHGVFDVNADESNEDRSLTGNLSIYPNPSDGSFTLETAGDLCIEGVELRDLAGRVINIRSRTFKECTITECIPPTDLGKGLYIIIATLTNGELLTNKIILR